MIVDCHSHMANFKCLPEIFFEGWARTIKTNLPDSELFDESRVNRLLLRLIDDPAGTKLFSEMEAAGIDKAVLLVIDFGFAFQNFDIDIEKIHLLHKELIDKDKTDRFIVFSGVDPRRGEKGVALFEKAVTEWGFKGLKLYPPCGYSPSDKRLFSFYEICQQRNLPVLTHVGPTTSAMSFKYTHPMEVDDAAYNFPGVNFILAHAGVVMYKEAALLAEYRPNIYLDLSGFQTEVNRGFFDGITSWHLARGLEKKLLFGTDWPIHRFFGSQYDCVKVYRDLVTKGVLTKQQYEDIMGNNISRILHLK